MTGSCIGKNGEDVADFLMRFFTGIHLPKFSSECFRFHDFVGSVEMEVRMDKIEDDLSALKGDVAALRCDVNTLNIDMAVVKCNYTTKNDLLEARHSIIMWVVSAILLAQLLPPVLQKFGL